MTPNLPNGVPTKGAVAANPPAAPADSAVLTETLRQHHTLTAQQSLGLSDESGLLVPFVVATVVATMLLAALTVGPYLWDKYHPAPEKTNKGTVPDKPETTAPSQPPQAPQTSTPGSSSSPKDAPGTPAGGKADVGKKPVEGGPKPPKPRETPFEKKDDLLSEIGK